MSQTKFHPWMALATSTLLLAVSTLSGCHAPGSQLKKALAPSVARHAPTSTPGDIADSVAEMDGLLAAAWEQAGLTPALPASDASYLRRVYLDLTGTIPTPEQARAFLDDNSEGKRGALVMKLVQTPGFARHWTNYWDDVLMGDTRARGRIDRLAFRQWLHGQLSRNTPYDELVVNLITADGVNSEGGRPDYTAWDLRSNADIADGVNGAVNWLLRGERSPQNLSGATARVFLGVQIQCAECHDHPTEKWTQNDFRRFTAAFMRVGGRPLERGRVMGIRRIEVNDVSEPTRPMRRRMQRTGYDDDDPRALDGTSLDGDNPRAALAAWLSARQNPWFAKALVNRMWAYFLGNGFVEPIDDFRNDSHVNAAPLLTALSVDFAQHGFDLTRLIRLICASTGYQRAAAGEKSSDLWHRFRLRPISADQLLDTVVAASGIEPVLEEVAGKRLPQIKLRLRRQFRFTFDVDEQSTADTFTGTVPQALMLLNGVLTSAGSSALEGSTLGAAARMDGGTTAVIEQLYLATLSRRPSSDERDHWLEFVRGAVANGGEVPRSEWTRGPVARVYRRKRLADLEPRDAAYEDLYWALLNSSEFFFIH